MKTKRFLLALLFVATTLSFAACGDKDDDDNDSNNNSELVGTLWEAQLNGTATDDELGEITMEMRFNMLFEDEENGRMDESMLILLPTGGYIPEENDSDPFTYALKGNTLTLTFTYQDEDEVETETGTMTYNRDENTFTMPIPEDADIAEEFGMTIQELFGTDQVVFHKVR